MFQPAGGIAGAVIVIHSKDTMPFPEDFGMVLKPGVYNAIKIKLVQTERLPYPDDNCITLDSDASNRDVYINRYNVTYSKTVRFQILVTILEHAMAISVSLLFNRYLSRVSNVCVCVCVCVSERLCLLAYEEEPVINKKRQ